MPVDGPTLADMLAMVDPLLASCMPCMGENLLTFKVLRLVSKDVAKAAVKSMTRWSVQLGERAPLKPAQLVQLMSSAAKVDFLTITLITTTGEDIDSFRESFLIYIYMCAIYAFKGTKQALTVLSPLRACNS